MIIINIKIIGTYSLTLLISRKLKQLEMNRGNKLKFAHEI